MQKLEISRKELLKIHEIACMDWQFIIESEYFPRVNLLKDTISFSQKEVDAMFNAATIPQSLELKLIFNKKEKIDDYLKKHRACDLKIGDKVLVKEIANSQENGWKGSWVSDMTNCVGQTLSILDDNGVYGFECKTKDGNSRYYYPYFVLEKVVEEYVPFTFEDDLLGKHVISKDKSSKGIITFQNKDRIEYGVYIRIYKILFEQYTFLDGSICGKLKQ